MKQKKLRKLINNYLKDEEKRTLKTLKPERFADKEHLKLSAKLISFCSLLLEINKIKSEINLKNQKFNEKLEEFENAMS